MPSTVSLVIRNDNPWLQSTYRGFSTASVAIVITAISLRFFSALTATCAGIATGLFLGSFSLSLISYLNPSYYHQQLQGNSSQYKKFSWITTALLLASIVISFFSTITAFALALAGAFISTLPANLAERTHILRHNVPIIGYGTRIN